jgi:hypothetical protein
MDSKELLAEIAKQLIALNDKNYDDRSFRSGYLLGYAKALVESTKIVRR